MILIPTHLFLDPIAVISGSITYDVYGNEQFSTSVLVSGTGRIVQQEVRTVEDGEIIFSNSLRAIVKPSLEVSIGQILETAQGKFRINQVFIRNDLNGIVRYKTLILEEVAQ